MKKKSLITFVVVLCTAVFAVGAAYANYSNTKQDDKASSNIANEVKKNSVVEEVSKDPFSNNAFSKEQLDDIKKIEKGTGKMAIRARYEMSDESLKRPRPDVKDFERVANGELTMESFVKDYGYPDLVTGFGIPNFVYFLDGDKSVNISSAGIYLIDGKSTKLSDKPFGGAKEKDKLFLTYSVK